MNKQIEVRVGEIVEFGNESFICVKDVPTYCKTSCLNCDLNHSPSCLNVKCSSRDRIDNANVHFVRQEGGNE